jgi:sulfonate dioxygenase
MLRMEEHPPVGGDTAWVSQYGLYDALSKTYQKLFDGLHAVHTSRLQYDTILDLWGTGPNRPPLDSHHPAVRSHPVTGLKALNVNEGFVTAFAELKKAESGSSVPGIFLLSTDMLTVVLIKISFWTLLSHTFTRLTTISFDGSGRLALSPCGIIGLSFLADNEVEKKNAKSSSFRCTIHRVIPGKYASGTRRGIRTTVFGEKRKNGSVRLVRCYIVSDNE